MKQLLIIMGLIFSMGVVLSGCYQDVIYPDIAIDPDGPPQAVSYKVELEPLFNNQCALSGCHVTGSVHKPWMETGLSYKNIVNGGYVNTSLPKASTLYIMINSEMQEYIPSAKDRQKVYDWIRNGAPNN